MQKFKVKGTIVKAFEVVVEAENKEEAQTLAESMALKGEAKIEQKGGE